MSTNSLQVRREGLAPPKVDRPHGLQPCAIAAPPPTQCGNYSRLRSLFQNENKDALLTFTDEGVAVCKVPIEDFLVGVGNGLARERDALS